MHRVSFLIIVFFLNLGSAEVDNDLFNKMLSDGRQSELEDILEFGIKDRTSTAEELYYYAVLKRSRFYKDVFVYISEKIKNKVGKERSEALSYLIKIDARIDADYAFKNLHKIALETKDTSILWMACISCCELNKNEVGGELYSKLAQQWNPGPILMHQTYANILDELGEYESALKYRELAMMTKRTSWNVDAYGNTLVNLKRYIEAEAAYRESLNIKFTTNAQYNLASVLYHQLKYQEAESIYKEYMLKEPNDIRPYVMLGTIYRETKKFEKSKEYYEKAISMEPNNVWPLKRLEVLYREMNKVADADRVKLNWQSIESGMVKVP